MNAISSPPLPARPLALPNLLTYARIAAVPVVVGLLYWQSIFDGPLWLRWVALAFFIAAGVTDILDGYLARTWGQQSSLGRMLDPIADKLLVGILIAALAWDGSFSGWDMIPACAILFREFFIPGLREFLGNTQIVLPVSWLAKWKTTLQLVALAAILFERIVPGFGLVSDILLWVAGALTLWTGFQYLRASWPHLVEEQK